MTKFVNLFVATLAFTFFINTNIAEANPPKRSKTVKTVKRGKSKTCAPGDTACKARLNAKLDAGQAKAQEALRRRVARLKRSYRALKSATQTTAKDVAEMMARQATIQAVVDEINSIEGGLIGRTEVQTMLRGTQQEVAGIMAEIKSDLDTRINDLEDRIQALEITIAEHDAQIAANTKEIAAINVKLGNTQLQLNGRVGGLVHVHQGGTIVGALLELEIPTSPYGVFHFGTGIGYNTAKDNGMSILPTVGYDYFLPGVPWLGFGFVAAGAIDLDEEFSEGVNGWSAEAMFAVTAKIGDHVAVRLVGGPALNHQNSTEEFRFSGAGNVEVLARF